MASSAPLPPGWEARWDPNQRAFFYIDHATKKTTWQDPRIGYQQPTQPPAQQYGGYNYGHGTQQHQQAARPAVHVPVPMPVQPQSLNQSTVPFSDQNQGIAMTTKYKQFGSTITSTDGDSDEDFDTNFDHLFNQYSDEPKVDMEKLMALKQKFPAADEDTLKRLLLEKHNDVVKCTNMLHNMGYKEQHAVQHPPPKVADITQRLNAMFPNATPHLIDQVMNEAGDEKEARTMLEAMGYTATYPATHRSHTPSRQTSPTKTASTSRQTSPAKRSPTPTSPAKPKLSQAEKSRMENKIHGQFPSYDMSVIKMALNVCEYHEDRVKAVLERIGGTALSDGRKAPPSRPGTSQNRHRSPSPKPLSPSALEPVSMLDDSQSTSTRSGATASSSSAGHRSFSPSKASSSRPTSSKTSIGSRVSTPKKKTSPPNHQNKHTQQARAKTVTDTRSQRVVSRQPQRDEYKSEYRTEPKGPDPSLCQGPNKWLLLNEYTQAKGPNPELRQGPDASRVQGSQGAMGPDRSLHCGPEHSLHNGPSQQAQQSVLVTAI